MLLFAVPKTATRFSAYEFARAKLQRADGTASDATTLFCGLASGVAEAVVAVTPMDTIKVKLIHDQLSRPPEERRYRGLAHGIRTIVQEEGLGGVYRGLVATIIKQSSNQAVRWLVYVRAKEWLAGLPLQQSPRETPLSSSSSSSTLAQVPPQQGSGGGALGVLHTVGASLAAATASVLGNAPVDVVKTRLQGLQAAKYAGVLDCAVKIAQREGLGGFYKGVGPRLARVCIETSVLMVLYEDALRRLDSLWPSGDS